MVHRRRLLISAKNLQLLVVYQYRVRLLRHIDATGKTEYICQIPQSRPIRRYVVVIVTRFNTIFVLICFHILAY